MEQKCYITYSHEELKRRKPENPNFGKQNLKVILKSSALSLVLSSGRTQKGNNGGGLESESNSSRYSSAICQFTVCPRFHSRLSVCHLIQVIKTSGSFFKRKKKKNFFRALIKKSGTEKLKDLVRGNRCCVSIFLILFALPFSQNKKKKQ